MADDDDFEPLPKITGTVDKRANMYSVITERFRLDNLKSKSHLPLTVPVATGRVWYCFFRAPLPSTLYYKL